MPRVVRDAPFLRNDSGDPGQGPYVGREPKRIRPAFEQLAKPSQLRPRQLGFPPGSLRPFEAAPPRGLQLPMPAVDGLPMDAHLAGDFRFTQALAEQLGGLHAPLLQGHKIAFHSGWISHTGYSSTVT